MIRPVLALRSRTSIVCRSLVCVDQQVLARPLSAPAVPEGATPLSTPPETLLDTFSFARAAYAERPAIGTAQEDGTYLYNTYGEIGDFVDKARGFLASQGVERGDRIAVISNNRQEWVVLAYAAYGLGASIVPLYEAMKPSEWEFILNDSGAILAFVAHPHMVDIVGGEDCKVPSVRDVLCFDEFGTMLEVGAASPAPELDIQPDELATVIYTSGTTGNPKGVMLSHRNIIHNILGIREVIGDNLNYKDSSLSFLPWAHVYGQVVELHHGIFIGGTTAVCQGVDKLLDNLAEVKPTVLVSVPQVFTRIYDGVKTNIAQQSPIIRAIFALSLTIARMRRNSLNEGKPSAVVDYLYGVVDKVAFSKIKARLGGNMRVAVLGGAALSVNVQHFFYDIGISMVEGYGLTETAPIVAMERVGLTKKLAGGLREAPGTTLRILDAEGNEVPRDVDGEICTSGPHVMVGYNNLPDATGESFITTSTGEKMFRTGDRGRLTESGRLLVTGRVKEQYKLANGKFVSPTAVEEAIKVSRFISQAFVHGRNQPFNVALISLDQPAVKEWAEFKKISLPDIDESASVLPADHPAYQLVSREIARHTKSLKHYEIPKEFAVLVDPMSIENGLLTQKLSMKRDPIQDRYGPLLASLYGDAAEEEAE